MFETRKPMYDLAIEKFQDNIIIGNGWGSYKYIYNQEMLNKEREYMDSHNIYLQLLCECGIIGFVVVVSGMLYVLIKSIKALVLNKSNETSRKYLQLCLAFQIYVMLDGILGNAFHDIPILYPYMLFNAFLFSQLNNEREEEIWNKIIKKILKKY